MSSMGCSAPVSKMVKMTKQSVAVVPRWCSIRGQCGLHAMLGPA